MTEKKQRGRPAGPVRPKRVDLRLTIEEWEALQRARGDQSVSDYLRGRIPTEPSGDTPEVIRENTDSRG